MSSGKKQKKVSRSELGARDRRIVSDLIRLKLLTNDAIQQLHLPSSKANATVKVTSRLVRSGWMKGVEFSGRQQYFVAGPTLIRVFGLPTNRGKPLGPQSLATQLAILELVASSKPQLCVLNATEVATLVPDSTKSLRLIPHAIEPGNLDSPLRIVRVDLGREPRSLAKKLKGQTESLLARDYYKKLMDERKLIVVVLTTSDTKKKLIEAAIAKLQWPKGLRFKLVTVSVLGFLLGGTSCGD